VSFTIGIDIGGTFTDTVVIDDAGAIATYKSPTTPGALLEGLLANLRDAAADRDLSLERFLASVERVAHGTTAATNAFIERRGAKVALLTTRGFEDTIFMQRQMGMTAGLSPAEVTAHANKREPEPLVHRRLVFGIRERVDWSGAALGPLREDDVRAACAAIAAAGVEAVAICFLWSFKNPAHERRTAEIVRDALPGAYVSVSSELVPRLGEYERTATTVVNAYLGPLVEQYTRTLEERLPVRNLLLLDSGGSVMTPAEAGRAPVRLLLSGPSGGVTASKYLGAALGHADVITFDMGGTSTDVSLVVGGESLQRHETESGKYHLLLPMVDVRAIGAGGGSIARVEEGGYLRVGPQSAGADPGPACYRRGGTLPTVTDADLVLGILDPERFLGGRLGLDVAAATEAIRTHVADPLQVSVEEAAMGIKRVVDARMGDLLRTVTIEQGHDPRELVLYAFGGAGATHAPAFALELVGDDADPARIDAIFAELEQRGNERLAAQDVPSDQRQLARFVEVRFRRQTKTIPVPWRGSAGPLLEDFLAAYATRYSADAIPETAGFELVTFVVEARGLLSRPRLARYEPGQADPSRAVLGRRRAYDAGSRSLVEMPILDGAMLSAGNRFDGPAVVEYPGTTVAVASGQTATVDELLGISIRRAA